MGKKRIHFRMYHNENNYYDFYQKAKITPEELKKFQQFKNKTSDELNEIGDHIYDCDIISKNNFRIQ